MVKVGDFVCIVIMKGEPEYEGRIGEVKLISPNGSLFGTWGDFAIEPEFDTFIVMSLEEIEKKQKELEARVESQEKLVEKLQKKVDELPWLDLE